MKNGLEGTSLRDIKEVESIVCWLPTYGYEGENFPHLYLCFSELAFQVFLLEGLLLCQVGSPLCVNSQNLEFAAEGINLALVRCLAPVMACLVLSRSLLITWTLIIARQFIALRTSKAVSCLLASIRATCCIACFFAFSNLVNTD